jgi:hypothetical protein
MQPVNAAGRADEIINLLLTHQEDPFGKFPLQDESQARKTAQVLATFRQELIAHLVQQQ